MNQKDKNILYTDRWRKSIGNNRRKVIYNKLLDLGVNYKDAMTMRFWSIERINEHLKTLGIEGVVDYE